MRDIPVDTSKGEQHKPDFRAVNPNGKVPAIVDTEGPGGKERASSVPAPSCSTWVTRPGNSWLHRRAGRSCSPGCFSLLSVLAPFLWPGGFSGQAVHFQFAAREGLEYARNRYRREAERHSQFLEDHLAGRQFIVGDGFTIADISAWGWLDRAPRIMKGEAEPLAAFPNISRWFKAIDGRPAVARRGQGPRFQERER